MAEKRVLGAFLLDSGRMTQADVERALEHQRTHGGYFGEAAVELGILRREEIDWALASQFDVPFIFPDAHAADPRVAELVSPAWALAHLAVPILRSGDAIIVVVADPLDGGALDELRARTGLEVEMALASASRIRELIHHLYDDEGAGGAGEGAGDGRGDQRGERPGERPTELADFVTEALAEGADRIGVSARGTTAQGWYSVGDRRERRPLESGWAVALEAILEPSPLAAAREGQVEAGPFEATLSHGGRQIMVDMQVATSLSGAEVLMRPRRRAAPSSSGAKVPDSIRMDLRLLARAGGARIGVTGTAVDVLAQLPALVLGDTARAAHVTRQPDVPGVFSLPVSDDVDFVALLESYSFDALTVDLPLDDGRLAGILACAPIAFASVPSDAETSELDRAGIEWTLSASPDQGDLAWELRPVNR